MDECGEIVVKRRHCYAIEWKIEDFLVTLGKVYHYSTSPLFEALNESWYFLIGGDDEWLDLHLHNESYSNYEEDSVCFTVGLKAAGGALHKSKKATHCFTRSNDEFVWSRMMKMEELRRQMRTLCPNGMLTFYCEFCLNWDSQEDAESQTLPHDHNAILAENISDLYLKRGLCDVTIDVGHRKFPAHRSILAARSTVFASMLENDIKGKKSGVIKIDDCDPDVFHDALIYLYTAKVDMISPKNVITLYGIADKYDVSQLTYWCEQFLLTNLSIELFYDVVVLATKFNNSTLIKAAEDFFAKHFQEILVTAKWKNFMKEHSIAANKLFIKCAKTYKRKR